MQVQSTNCCEYTHSVPVYMHAVPTPLTALVCSSVVGPPALYPPARLGGADAKGSSFFCVRVFSWASGVVARLEVHVLHYIYIYSCWLLNLAICQFVGKQSLESETCISREGRDMPRL